MPCHVYHGMLLCPVCRQGAALCDPNTAGTLAGLLMAVFVCGVVGFKCMISRPDIYWFAEQTSWIPSVAGR